ncbi:hypothetical protein ACOSP7_024911 [Xanthoceras sorbifolium]
MSSTTNSYECHWISNSVFKLSVSYCGRNSGSSSDKVETLLVPRPLTTVCSSLDVMNTKSSAAYFTAVSSWFEDCPESTGPDADTSPTYSSRGDQARKRRFTYILMVLMCFDLNIVNTCNSSSSVITLYSPI